MKPTTYGHPDGPESQVVSECYRGRWQCQDFTVESESLARGSANANSNRPPDTRVDDGSPSPPLESNVDVRGRRHQHVSESETTGRFPQNSQHQQQQQSGEAGPSTSTAGAQQHSPCIPAFTSALDSNSNASLRRLRSRTTKTGHASDTGESREIKDPRIRVSSNDVWGLGMLAAAVVVCPYLLNIWIFSPDSDAWHWLYSLLSLFLQTAGVLLTGLILLFAAQGQFSTYWLRQWIAHVFQLELKEDLKEANSEAPATKLPAVAVADEDASPTPAATTTTGDGDKVKLSSTDPVVARSTQSRNEPVENQRPVTMLPESVTVKNANTTKADMTQAGFSNADPPKDESELVSTMEKQAHQTSTNDDMRISGRKSYRKMMKNMYRKFQLIRRKYKMELQNLKSRDREAGEVLSRVQLSLPVLEREKQALLAELEAIHKQHEEEKRRNHDLVARLHRLNQHFLRIGIGTAQASSLANSRASHIQNHHSTTTTTSSDNYNSRSLAGLPAPYNQLQQQPQQQQQQQPPPLYQHPNHQHRYHHDQQQNAWGRPSVGGGGGGGSGSGCASSNGHGSEEGKMESAPSLRHNTLRSNALPH